jgi:hypothetical protein
MYTKDSDDAADRAMVDGFVKVLRSSPKPPGCLVLDSQFAVNIFKVCTCHNGKGKCRNNQLLEDALTEAGYKDGVSRTAWLLGMFIPRDVGGASD